MTPNHPSSKTVAIIGAGPAGLMAAEVLSGHGLAVDVYDAKPSAGRKFLVAGKGGLNLTHSEPFEGFLSRYGSRRVNLLPMLRAFGADELRQWAHELGFETFVGTSGRVFPEGMKSAPLLRAWLERLRKAGVRFHFRHEWLGWDDDLATHFATPDGEIALKPDATVLALGGGSWPKTGSTGAWVEILRQHGVELAPLKPANCGFRRELERTFSRTFCRAAAQVGGCVFHRFAGRSVQPAGRVCGHRDRPGRQPDLCLLGSPAGYDRGSGKCHHPPRPCARLDT